MFRYLFLCLSYEYVWDLLQNIQVEEGLVVQLSVQLPVNLVGRWALVFLGDLTIKDVGGVVLFNLQPSSSLLEVDV